MLYIETTHVPTKSEIRYNWEYLSGSYDLIDTTNSTSSNETNKVKVSNEKKSLCQLMEEFNIMESNNVKNENITSTNNSNPSNGIDIDIDITINSDVPTNNTYYLDDVTIDNITKNYYKSKHNNICTNTFNNYKTFDLNYPMHSVNNPFTNSNIDPRIINNIVPKKRMFKPKTLTKTRTRTRTMKPIRHKNSYLRKNRTLLRMSKRISSNVLEKKKFWKRVDKSINLCAFGITMNTGIKI